jgi:thymidylate synthase (FAD)
MQVRLISKTVPLVDPKVVTAEDLVVYTARVSNPGNQTSTETAPRLIKYLIKHKHWSPFEMVDFCFEIQTSRAIAAQILRHRSANFQEFSQRYAEANAFEPIEFRFQDYKNRQNSLQPSTQEDFATISKAKGWADHLVEEALKAYNAMLEDGIAKETARMILPLCTQTTLYMKNNLRNWIHYVNLRADPDTQKEHREIAVAIRNILIQECPNVAEALEWIK